MLWLIITTLLRTLFSYVLLLTMTRLMGRKAISQMTFFDFAISVTLGSVSANISIGSQFTLLSASLTLIFLTSFAILTGFLRLKSFNFNKLVNSEPIVAIENGKINEKNIRKLRFTLQDLTSMLREKNIFDLADVEFAVIENDGILSVLPKSQKQPVTPSDLDLKTEYVGLTTELILDGNIMYENLNGINLDKKWLMDQLYKQHITSPNEVFFAALDSSGKLYVSKRQNGNESEGQHGIE